MMRVLGLSVMVLACVCWPSLLCAQEVEGVGAVGRGAPVPARPVVVPKGRITGHIYCGDTHKPARGATLLLIPVPSTGGGQVGGTNVFARAGMNGSFDFEHVAPGEYAVIGLLPGYLSPMTEMAEEGQDEQMAAPLDPEQQRQWVQGQQQRFQEQQKRMQEIFRRLGTVTVRGEETETLETSLQRGAAVSGRVLYSDGSPASQVTIEVEDVTRKTGRRDQQMNFTNPQAMTSMFTHQSMGTNDQGRFRIAGLRPGHYRIAAVQSPEGDFMNDGDGGMGMVYGFSSGPGALRVYSEGTLHRKDAKVYELKAGEETSGMDFTISPEVYHQVRGVVSAKDGRPVMMGKVELTDAADDTLAFSSSIHSNGEFVFPTVPAGTYTLKATGAKIGVPNPQYGMVTSLNEGNSKITDAFADGSTSVIVKESDVADVQLSLTSVPLPPEPKVPPGMPVPDVP